MGFVTIESHQQCENEEGLKGCDVPMLRNNTYVIMMDAAMRTLSELIVFIGHPFSESIASTLLRQVLYIIFTLPPSLCFNTLLYIP